MKLAAALVTVLALATSPVQAKRAPKPDPTQQVLAELHIAARCDDKASPLRPWCVAADGWGNGVAGKLPVGKVLIGISVGRNIATPTPWDLTNDPAIHLVALAVRRDGAQHELRLTAIAPDDDDDAQALAAAIGNVAVVLKGRGATARVGKGLGAHLRSLGKQGGHAATKSGLGWTWLSGQGAASEARKVGKFWVVIETPEDAPGHRIVSILTDKWR